MRFPRQEYWNRLPFHSPGDLPDPEVKPTSLASPILAGGFFSTASPRKLQNGILLSHIKERNGSFIDM